MKNVHLINQHIYITSDEEIKEGDFFYVKTSNIHGGNIVTKCLNLGKGCWSEHILTDKIDEKGYHPSHCKKIILTTDQDLIKDGVQPINDEFLEWFVKNPSCEFVEIKQPFTPSSIVYGINTNLYKIIIPQEEPKQGFPLFDKEKSDAITKSGRELVRKLQSKTEQETLEEAAEEYVKNDFDDTLKLISKYSFKDGAKWQANNIIEELEMHIVINEDDWSRNPQVMFRNFIEQFKKK